MLPAKTFYDRILWDGTLDAALFTICYEDRPEGVVEVTFAAFDPALVPWHRIREFRCAGRVVWERPSRVVTRGSPARPPRRPGSAASPRRASG